MLLKLAEKLDLDIHQFEKDLENSELAKKVDSDFESGIISGVNGTPSFYVNGKKFDGGAEDLFQLLSTNEE
ncbi:DSBA-like thioredoxin domain protein [compost metagenome]